MWVTKLLISPQKLGFFAQKRPNLARNSHFWSLLAKPCWLIWCPVGGLVRGFGARAVSRKTSIYLIAHLYTNLVRPFPSLMIFFFHEGQTFFLFPLSILFHFDRPNIFLHFPSTPSSTKHFPSLKILIFFLSPLMARVVMISRRRSR